MNTKIALSGLSIFAALALVGGATFAFFSDSGTSSGNVFGSGSIDLKLGNGETAASDSVTATIGQANMIPGGTPVLATLNLMNSGTIAANHVDIVVTDVLTQAGSPPGSVTTNPMDKYLKLTTLTYDPGTGPVDLLPSITNGNGNGFVDLEDLKNNNLTAGDLQNLGLAETDVDHPLVIGVQLEGTAPNDVQGDSVDVTLAVTLDQGPTH